MKYLSEITPAEVLFLTKREVTYQELLKITFIDLLFKQVLKTVEVERKAHVSESVRIYKYVTSGQNFKNYIPLNHEKFFLSSFQADNTMEVLFRNLVKIGYQNSKSLTNFKKELIVTPTLKKCFSQNVFQRLFCGYSFTEYGTELKRKVDKEVQNLNTQLSSSNDSDNQKIVDLIKIIGANIFLLQNVDYELLNQIDNDLATEMKRNNATDVSTGCSGCGFYDYSSSFDSGCSGDSGCGSGCSGCGGD